MTVLLPAPIQRELVPEVGAVAPVGLSPVDIPLTAGLPHRIGLATGLTLLVVMATGVVRVWITADPAMLVSSTDEQYSPVATSSVGGPVRLGAPPIRVLVEVGDRIVGSIPLVAGLRWVAGGVELAVIGWRLHAGTIVGAGDYGSRLHVAWRSLGRVGAASNGSAGP